jgi:hypothetical protein
VGTLRVGTGLEGRGSSLSRLTARAVVISGDEAIEKQQRAVALRQQLGAVTARRKRVRANPYV